MIILGASAPLLALMFALSLYVGLFSATGKEIGKGLKAVIGAA
jgi:hypothetical protein